MMKNLLLWNTNVELNVTNDEIGDSQWKKRLISAQDILKVYIRILSGNIC